MLFADLKGSMELLADRDPEEARNLLDPVLERMMESVHHYEGTVNQVMGDGIMALFGAPIGHEDHAVRACHAALRMLRRIGLYADEIQREGGTPVQIRVGLNSGEVVVRAIGSDLRMDYSAVGQTTHLAARMEQMAKPGSALITGDTLKLAEGYIQVRPLGAVPVKGLEAPTPVYELTALIPTRSRFQASAAARGLTRFVGRDSELQQLGQALERAAAGHGQAVAVVGEAGVGKSRLTWELTRSHRTHGWLVLESGSVSYGKATPYLPVIDLLKTYFRIQERDDPRAIRERVAGKLLMLDRGLEPLLTPPLLALLDVPVDEAAWDTLDRAQRRRRTLEAVKQLLLRESQVQPLLVVFEDLHWIDSETQALLDGLIESLPTARMLLLVNYRPEYEHTWGRKTYYLQLRIDPLPPESADALLHALLGDDRTLAPLRKVLIHRTEGNPFFLEESVRTLVETQVLIGERGTYRLAKAPDAWQIPATAQAILVARIDRLSPDDKRLLQAAAVIGKDMPFALLQAIADVPEEDLRRGLAHLQAAEFLYETSLFPDLEYTFKHALTHEVAYGSVLQDRRRALHARIVDGIEAVHAERLGEHVERLAHHAVRGEMWDKALAYLHQAGAKAMARSVHRQAVAHFEQALVVLERLPATSDTVELSIDLRLDLRTALLPSGEFARIRVVLREAEALAVRAGDRRRLVRAAQFLCVSAYVAGEHAQALASGNRALVAATELGDVGLQAVSNNYIGFSHLGRTDYSQAEACLRRSAGALVGPLLRERLGQVMLVSAASRSFLAWSLVELGKFTEATAFAEEAVQIAEAATHPASVLVAHLGLGLSAVRQGRLGRGMSSLERALAICRDLDLPLYVHYVAPPLALAYALSGRPREAVNLLEQAVQQDVTMGVMCHHALTLATLGEVYLEAGRPLDARASADRALQLSRERGEAGHEAHALRVLGDANVAVEPLEAGHADAAYRQALALAEKHGMRPLVAHCHLGLGKLYRRIDDRAKGDESLAAAAMMYREMQMGFWLEKAEAHLGRPNRSSS